MIQTLQNKSQFQTNASSNSVIINHHLKNELNCSCVEKMHTEPRFV